MGYQNFFATKLFTDIGAADTVITLETPPIETSGRLVLEARNPTQREIIKYTGVSGNQITGVTRGQGGTTAKTHLKNALVEMNMTAGDISDLYDAFNSFASTNGSGWYDIPETPSLVSYLGQRSYEVTIPGVDLTNIFQPGTRIRTTRNTPAPTQSTSLNGTTQYWVKTAPSKMTFTDDFTVMAHVYLTEYGASRNIVSRRTANDGFALRLSGHGQIEAVVVNAGTSNRVIISVQAVPLNTWTHIAATYDISGGVYNIYINGISVLTYSTSAGAMTSIVQSGDLEVGSATAGGFFKGNIAQVAIFSSILNQSTVRSYISQGLTGSEPTLLSAWSFNGVATDLMTTTPNDLTPQAGVGYSALAPFGTQANLSVNNRLDYGIVTKAVATTDTILTVQLPDGCTIPTSGTISAVSYSPVKAPYGFPADKKRWTITARMVGNGNVVGGTTTGSIAGVWGELALARVFLPVGVFFQYSKIIIIGSSTSANFTLQSQYDPISPAAAPGYDSEGGDRHRMNVAGAFLVATHRHVQTVVNNSPQDFKLWCAITSGSGTQEAYFEVGIPSTISFENALL